MEKRASQIARNSRPAELDRRGSADSSSRLALTDLPADLPVVDGEAKLLLAYLMGELADILSESSSLGGGI